MRIALLYTPYLLVWLLVYANKNDHRWVRKLQRALSG